MRRENHVRRRKVATDFCLDTGGRNEDAVSPFHKVLISLAPALDRFRTRWRANFQALFASTGIRLTAVFEINRRQRDLRAKAEVVVDGVVVRQTEGFRQTHYFPRESDGVMEMNSADAQCAQRGVERIEFVRYAEVKCGRKTRARIAKPQHAAPIRFQSYEIRSVSKHARELVNVTSDATTQTMFDLQDDWPAGGWGRRHELICLVGKNALASIWNRRLRQVR